MIFLRRNYLLKRYFTQLGSPSLRRCSRNTTSEAHSLLNFEKDGFCLVYVDGACLMNGRRGAVGAIGVYWADNHPWNVSAQLQGKRQTSGRAELQAACEALRIAKFHNIAKLRIYTDSLIVAKG